MSILFNEQQRCFEIHAGDSSYFLAVTEHNYLAHLYWGKRIRFSSTKHHLRIFQHCSFSPNPVPGNSVFSLDTVPLEYPSYGTSDYRHPAIEILHSDGSSVVDLRYHSHKIYSGKPKLENLPATYSVSDEETQTLEIFLTDQHSGLTAVLRYSAYEKLNVITRSVTLINNSTTPISVNRVLSASVDFNHNRFEMINLHGSWARERHIDRKPIIHGMQSIESRRGASSHHHNPFLALASPETTETFGDAYGFSLVYSGNFLANVEVCQYNTTRVSMGINPFDFCWNLESGESFNTPEVVMVYSSNGIGEMSRTYHKLYRTRLCRGIHRDKQRPILVNNWEATYFDFNHNSIMSIANEAKNLGIEMFVLDDGWFGKRNSDTSSLGDWYVNEKKLPNGLSTLSEEIQKLGLKFGLWFEPEMVSPESDLYKAHPDWCLHVPGRNRSEGRNQLILDFTRKDVRDTIVAMICNILDTVPIQYIKWDMNRNMTEIGSLKLPASKQRETAHRYILGLYEVLEKLTTKYPNILFESCSGGGGRFDPGMLYYMPQTWTSDNTDAVERLKIQYGTSLVFPAITMGAHVSAVPNHQVHRTTPIRMRGHVAMSGNFGYELDLTNLSEEEKDIVKEQVSFYNGVRHLVQEGDFFRLQSPFDGNETAWMFVSPDKKEAFVSFFRVLATADPGPQWLKLEGVDPELSYTDVHTNESYHGDQLMYSGLPIPQLFGDYQSYVWKFKVL